MYQVIARKFRPQRFNEMVGQEPLVTTLQNALRLGRLPHAYLFSGPRGTGKTSIARLFAKAINCENRSIDIEPCNHCSSCVEIQSGSSLDVLEIDGASHRGIDDIRKINETVGFSALSGRYKIYIIDEVHMLTKEAFNALLKTLEEPPPKVKFLFATTEPHKVLPTILSRCQRFQLQRISPLLIVQKLKSILANLGIEAEEGALALIAKRAEGGLRDAESLLDQIISFQEGIVTAASVANVLGIPSKETFYAIDKAVFAEDYPAVQALASAVFQEGGDLSYFYESLLDHFRTLLLAKLKALPAQLISTDDLKKYDEHHQYYTREGLMALLDFLLETQSRARNAPITETSLEQTLYKIVRLSKLESVGDLVRKLSEMEKKLGSTPTGSYPQPSMTPQTLNKPMPVTPQVAPYVPPVFVAPTPVARPVEPRIEPKVEPKPAAPIAIPAPAAQIAATAEVKAAEIKAPQPVIEPIIPKPPAPVVKPPEAIKPLEAPSSITVDPTPSAADLKGTRPAMKASPTPAAVETKPTPVAQTLVKSGPTSPKTDTLLQFAAIELEGKITKH